MKAIAVIKKESVRNRDNGPQEFHTVLSLIDEGGESFGSSRFLPDFQAVGNLLQREAGVPYDKLQESIGRYDNSEEIRVPLTLENEEAIRNLGFHLENMRR